MDYIVHGIFQASIELGSLSLFQGIFPTQGSNPGVPQCRQILYQLSHQGSLSLLQGILLTQESNRGLLHCRQILYQLSYQRILNVFEVSTEKRNDIQNFSVPVSNDCMLTNHHHCQKIYMYTHQDKMTYSYQLWFCVISCQIHLHEREMSSKFHIFLQFYQFCSIFILFSDGVYLACCCC